LYFWDSLCVRFSPAVDVAVEFNPERMENHHGVVVTHFEGHAAADGFYKNGYTLSLNMHPMDFKNVRAYIREGHPNHVIVESPKLNFIDREQYEVVGKCLRAKKNKFAHHSLYNQGVERQYKNR
jgi:hypothetical protein